MRKDWQYTEPNEIDAIWAESDPTRPLGKVAEVDLDDSSKRVEEAFLGSVAGCMLGKPIEVRLTGDEIKIALKKINDWPLTEYISENIKSVIPTVHRSFDETVREKIKFVAPDDDINYTIMGMLILEEFGPGFTHKDVRELWVKHLPLDTTFGPERTMLIKSGLESLGDYGHCRVYQEIGMLINTMKFANDVGDGICIQVSQGADTDSFGASAGSILGAYFGPGSLDQKWTLPFNDDIHTGMAWFFERSLSDLASRMGELPKRIYPTL